jgi:predicted DNA-binding transcriptional regulator YafY
VAQRDGSCIAEWTLSSTVEAKSFILSFGAAAEVLEPPELRQDIAKDLQLALQSYGEPPGYEPNGKPTPSKRTNRQRAPR